MERLEDDAPGLVFRQEPVEAVADEAARLAREHWREVEAELHGGADYVLDRERYLLLERLGMLAVTTARDGDGRLAGYAAFTLAPCAHLGGGLVAALDGLYLAPRARRGLNALTLLRSAERALFERGAHVVQYSSPASRPCGALYKRLGARQTETIWHKRLVAAGSDTPGPGPVEETSSCRLERSGRRVLPPESS